MTPFIKNQGVNLVIKLVVTLGVVAIIYLFITTFLPKEATNLERTVDEVYPTEPSKENPNVTVPTDREQVAQGLLIMNKTDITVPEAMTLSQYEKILASTSLDKKKVAIHEIGDANSQEFDDVLKLTTDAGPVLVMRDGNLKIFVPEIDNVIDRNFTSQNQNLVRVYVDSILDKNGKNILDSESPFEQKTFFNKLNFESIPEFTEHSDYYYKAERVLHLKGDQLSLFDDVKKVSGSVVLNLPIAVSKYDMSLDQIVTKSTIKAGNATVVVKDVKDGALYLSTKSSGKTVLYVKCFNHSNEIISTAMIVAIDPEDGYTKQTIMSFGLEEQADHLEVYAPSEVVSKKYKFAI